MSLKFFILGLCVLVSFVQVKTQNNDQIQNNVLDGKPNQFRSMELESRQKRSEDEDEKGTTKKKRENSVDEAPKAKQEDARRFNPFEAVGKFVEAPGKIVIAQAMKKLYETYTNNDKPFGPTYDTTYGSPPSGRRMNGDNPPPEEVRMSSMAQRQPEVKMSSMVQPPPGYNYGQPGYYGGNYMQYGTPVQTSMHSYASPVRKYHTYGNSIPDYGNTYVQNSMPGYESHSNSIPGFGPSHPAKISTQYSYATSQPTYGQLSTNSYQGMNQNDGSPYFQNRRANSGMNKDLPEKIKHNYGKMVKTVNAEFIKSKNHKTVDPDISLRNGFIGDVFQKDLDNKSSEETTQVEYEIPALGSAAEIASDADIAVGNRRFLGKETSEENDQDENSISTVIENVWRGFVVILRHISKLLNHGSVKKIGEFFLNFFTILKNSMDSQ